MINMYNCKFIIYRWYLRAKLGVGLLSGKYSAPKSEKDDEGRQGIAPRMFKHLIGRGHAGFMSNRQQDAQEFILHLINILDVNQRSSLTVIHNANIVRIFARWKQNISNPNIQ